MKFAAKIKGLLLTVLLSVCALFFFFGRQLSDPNHYFFARHGDGLQSYYHASYQLKYDSAYFYSKCANYPYGENVFFNSNQPVWTATLKLINARLFKTEDKVVGIFNYGMLLGIPLCALFLFLVFYELKVHEYFAAFAAVAISFLSPQLLRLPAHFGLAYPFVIPVIFYFLLLFEKKRTFSLSILIGFFIFFMAGIHLYYIVFFGALLIIYFLYDFFLSENKKQAFLSSSLHMVIQLFIPYIILQLLIHSSNNVSDRTSFPYGIFMNKASLRDIFFPFGKPYEALINKIYTPKELHWEGLCYMGAFAILVSAVYILRKIIIFKVLKIRMQGDKKMLFVFLVTGFLLMLYALGFPFVINKNILHHISLLKQMRAVGRFSWLFFYAVNISVIWYVSHVLQSKNKAIKNFVMSLCVIVIGYDAYYLVRPISEETANRIEDWYEEDLKDIDAKKYQAIIPYPFYHIGSENIWTEPVNKDIITQNYIVSLRTGLPSPAALLARTSLSQSFNCTALSQEPYRSLKIVNDLPNQKPFLALVKEDEIKTFRQDFLRKGVLLKKINGFSLYEISFATIKGYADSLYEKTMAAYSSSQTYPVGNFRSTHAERDFAYQSFDTGTGPAYIGPGGYTGNIKQVNVLFDNTLPAGKTEFTGSFWMKDFTTDLYPRSRLYISYSDEKGINYRTDSVNIEHYFTVQDGDWALVEFPVMPHKPSGRLKISVYNDDIAGKEVPLVIDELMIRPGDEDIYRIAGNAIMRNNRLYKKLK